MTNVHQCPQLSTMKGKYHTDKAKQKISEATSGKNNPFYGKKHTDKSKKKMSERKKGKTWEELYGEHKAKVLKILKSNRSSGKNNGMYNKSLFKLWMEKYGEEEANNRYIKWKQKLKRKHDTV